MKHIQNNKLNLESNEKYYESTVSDLTKKLDAIRNTQKINPDFVSLKDNHKRLNKIIDEFLKENIDFGSEIHNLHAELSTEAAEELKNLYNLFDIQSKIEKDKMIYRNTTVTSFEFWQRYLKSKGIDIQNCSAIKILQILGIKGPNAYVETSMQTESYEAMDKIRELEDDYKIVVEK